MDAVASGCVYSVGGVDTGDVDALVRLHERLGHMGFDRMVHVIKTGATLDIGRLAVSGPALEEARHRVLDCKSCVLGKGQRTAFGHRGVDKGNAPGETLHMDTYQTARNNGLRSWTEYGLVMTDPYSEYRWFAHLKTKDEGAANIIAIVRNAETQRGIKVKRLYADGGTEFINQTLKTFCSDNGIELHHPPARTQQLNGVAERSVRTSKDTARTMMVHAGTPACYWHRAALHAAYVWNRTRVAKATGMTPFEAMFGRKPSAQHWGVFGCDAFCHVPKLQRSTFSPKMEACIYLGHDHVQNCAIVHVLRTGKLMATRDVEYRETSFTHGAALGRGSGAVDDVLALGYTDAPASSEHTDGHEAAPQGGLVPSGALMHPHASAHASGPPDAPHALVHASGSPGASHASVHASGSSGASHASAHAAGSPGASMTSSTSAHASGPHGAPMSTSTSAHASAPSGAPMTSSGSPGARHASGHASVHGGSSRPGLITAPAATAAPVARGRGRPRAWVPPPPVDSDVEASTSESDSDDGEQYEVERIMGKRVVDGRTEYHTTSSGPGATIASRRGSPSTWWTAR